MNAMCRTGWAARTGAVLVLWACACPGSLAGPVSATPDAKAGGTQEGLRIHMNPDACPIGDDNERELSGRTITGTDEEFRACERLRAGNTVIADGADAAFRAGFRVALGTGFRVERGGRFAASVDPSRVRGGFVRDDTPASEPHYAVRFLMNPDSLTPGVDERLLVFEAEDRTGRPWLALVLRYDGGTDEKMLHVTAADGAATKDGAEFPVQAGWQAIELEWWASDPGSDNGKVNVLQDGADRPGLRELANEDGRVDTVRWGVLRGLETTDGHLDLDEFVSRRAGRIGPP